MYIGNKEITLYLSTDDMMAYVKKYHMESTKKKLLRLLCEGYSNISKIQG